MLEGADGGRFRVPRTDAEIGAPIIFVVRSDKVEVGKGDAALRRVDNRLPGTVRSVEYQGAWVQIGLEASDIDEFTVMLNESEFYANPISAGDRVVATWAAADVHVLATNE